MPSLYGLVWERQRVLVNEMFKFENVLKMLVNFLGYELRKKMLWKTKYWYRSKSLPNPNYKV
jgi:hypothetical protein